VPCLVRPLPEGLRVGCYEDDGLRFVDADRYGEPLTFTTPAALHPLLDAEHASPWNRAVLAFLTSLPGETRIVLYWC
jgi:hypothetical protein